MIEPYRGAAIDHAAQAAIEEDLRVRLPPNFGAVVVFTRLTGMSICLYPDGQSPQSKDALYAHTSVVEIPSRSGGFTSVPSALFPMVPPGRWRVFSDYNRHEYKAQITVWARFVAKVDWTAYDGKLKDSLRYRPQASRKIEPKPERPQLPERKPARRPEPKPPWRQIKK